MFVLTEVVQEILPSFQDFGVTPTASFHQSAGLASVRSFYFFETLLPRPFALDGLETLCSGW